jgi:hypothetical protein
VGAGVKTGASSVAMWANGADVTILSVVETLGVVVVGVVLSEGSEMWCSVGLVQAIVELAVKVFLDLVGSILKHTIDVGGVGVTVVVNPWCDAWGCHWCRGEPSHCELPQGC